MAVSASNYELEIDWDGDGSFEGGTENVSACVISAVITRGFSGQLARVSDVGTAQFVVDNKNREFSPPLDSDVVPRREVKFTMTYGATCTVLFRGFIESIMPSSGCHLDRQAVIDCVDAIDLLNKHEGRIDISENSTADVIIDQVVTAVYTAPDTNYQGGISVFPLSADRWSSMKMTWRIGWEDINAARKVEDCAVGEWGRFFISKAGCPTFHNRHQQPLTTTSSLTLSDSMVEMSYIMSVSEVYNSITVTAHPRTIGEFQEVIGQLKQQQPPRVDNGETETWVLKYRDPTNPSEHVGAFQAPGISSYRDFIFTSDAAGQEGINGSFGSSDTSDMNENMSLVDTPFGDRVSIAVTNNNGCPAFCQFLQYQARAIRTFNPIAVTTTSASSITAYQERNLPISVILLQNAFEARRIGEYLLDVYEAPEHRIEGITIFGNESDTLMSAVRDLELNDRITITEQQTGLTSYNGFLNKMTHNIIGGSPVVHTLTFGLETAYDIGAGNTLWHLDESVLESGTSDDSPSHILIY